MIEEQHRQTAQALLKILELLGGFNPKIGVGQLEAFLHVMLEPNLKQSDLIQMTGFEQKTLGRYVHDLASRSHRLDESGRNIAGLNLITVAPNPFNTRRNLLTPTPEGQAFLELLTKTLHETMKVTPMTPNTDL